MRTRMHILAIVLSTGLAGCVAKPDTLLVDTVYRGRHGVARQYLKDKLGKGGGLESGASAKKPDRNYALDRMRLGLTTLADGYAPEIHSAWDQVYQILRKASLNKNMAVASIVLNEDLKIWKGEPFEQALAYHYVGLHYAMLGSWDNARTAYVNALFPLKAVIKGRHSTVDVLAASRGQDESFFDRVTDEKTDFALGYLMAGIAAQQMGLATGDGERHDEAARQFQEAAALNPHLRQVIAGFDPGLYNTVLVVDYGRGPQKIATGPDRAIASFRPVAYSDGRRLVIEADGQSASYPWACDVNTMAQDHMWNNLQDMRIAKSYLGTGLLLAGGATTMIGAHYGSQEAVIAGLAAMAVGAVAKAGAHADTRYCELMPQRIYVAPLKVAGPGATVTLQVEGAPQSRIVLTGLNPPVGPDGQLLYVRMVSEGPAAPPWAISGRILYSNDYAPNAGRIRLPYILGGDCVRTPSHEVLASYQAAGFLTDLTLSDLRELYRMEGILWTIQEENGTPGLHVLEGGRSLLCPQPGSAGYARLFGERHAPYKPRSKRVQELAERVKRELQIDN
jgi:tetratricopeptide (TPR) repeat protein